MYCSFLRPNNCKSFRLEKTWAYTFLLLFCCRGKAHVFLQIVRPFPFVFQLLFLAFAQCAHLSVLPHLLPWTLLFCPQFFLELINKALPVQLVSRSVFPFHCPSCRLWAWQGAQTLPAAPVTCGAGLRLRVRRPLAQQRSTSLAAARERVVLTFVTLFSS